MLQRTLTFTVVLLALALGIGLNGNPLLGQHLSSVSVCGAQKAACSPCEDYFGLGGATYLPFAAYPDTNTPGLFRFVVLPHIDTNIVLLQVNWVDDHNLVGTTYPGDTFVYQFSHNGQDTMNGVGEYLIPEGMACSAYGEAFVQVTGLPQVITAAAAPILQEEAGLAAYPNPTKSAMKVVWLAKEADKYELTLFDMKGKALGAQRRFVNGAIDLDLSPLAPGLYQAILIGPANVRSLTLVRE